MAVGVTAIRAVLFDMDGVLVHSRPVWRALIRGLCRDLGYPEVSDADFATMWGQGVQADVARVFVRHTVAEIAALYDARFLDHVADLQVDPAGPEVFAALRARGLRIAVVTNTPRPLADAILEVAGLSPDALVGGTDAPRAKPAPDLVRLACARLGVAPDAAVMVGDSRYDREAAEAAGVPFCGFGGIAGRWSVGSLGEVVGRVGGRGDRAG